MRVKNRIILLVISFMFLLTGCKYSTLDEAIKKGIPYKVHEVVHIQKEKGVTAVLYTAIPDKKETPHITEPVLGVAFFKGNDEEGWENVGPNGWTHMEGEPFTMYQDFYREFDEDGNQTLELHVIFGEITNREVTRIQTLERGSEDQYKDAAVVDADSGRYYLTFGRTSGIRGLSEAGEVIHQNHWETN
nr:hypothetical protein [Neobacillus sp. Marseille-Q6967]